MSENAWSSGVGGAQCDECGETTIVRRFGDISDFDPDERWLCRPCAYGDNYDDRPAASTPEEQTR